MEKDIIEVKMDNKDFFKELLSQAQKIEIQLNEEQIDIFYRYKQLLIEWNKKMNLTAITETKDIILKHFIDSLTIMKYIKENQKVIDVGTGAGFPGLPLKIANPTLNIVLLDSLNKRINFLNEVINQNNLKNIKAIHNRIEQTAREEQYREGFDIVTSRAVANLAVLAEYMLPFAKIGGKCICMKGSEIEEELENSKNAIKLLGGKIIKIDSFELPQDNIKRNIIIIEKEKNTPNKYPRKPGTPSKEPLK